MEAPSASIPVGERVTVFPSAEELGRRLAVEIVDLVEAAGAEGRPFVLGCPGGRSPMSTYEAMGREFGRRGTDLSHLVIAMMDDYALPAGDGWTQPAADLHFSCRRFAHEDIQAVFNAEVSPERRVSDDRVWGPDPSDPGAYDGRLQRAGGVDLFILASGAGDGHVAFNPPGTSLDSTTRVVTLAEQTRRDNLATFPDFDGLDDVPTHGITVGVGTIAQVSRRAVMIVVGPDKRAAVERLLDGEGYDPSWPATVYRVIPGARLYVDQSAAGDLTRP